MKRKNKKKPKEAKRKKGRRREERKKRKKEKEKKKEKSEEKKGKKGQRKEKARKKKKKTPNWHPTPTTGLVSSCHRQDSSLTRVLPSRLQPVNRVLRPSSKLFPDAPPAIARTWLWPMNLWSSDYARC